MRTALFALALLYAATADATTIVSGDLATTSLTTFDPVLPAPSYLLANDAMTLKASVGYNAAPAFGKNNHLFARSEASQIAEYDSSLTVVRKIGTAVSPFPLGAIIVAPNGDIEVFSESLAARSSTSIRAAWDAASTPARCSR